MKNLLILLVTLFSFTATAQTAEELEMVNLVNQVRTNPKSFIPVIEDYIKQLDTLKKTNGLCGKNFTMKVIKCTSSANTSGLNDRLIIEAKKLIKVLNKTKPVCKLILNTDMYIITKNYAKYLYTTHKLEHGNVTKRFKALNILVSENLADGNMLEAMINLMVDYGVAGSIPIF